jgi:hypothetical protein
MITELGGEGLLEANYDGRPLTVDAASRHTPRSLGPGVGDGLVSGARDVTWRTGLFGPGANARGGNLKKGGTRVAGAGCRRRRGWGLVGPSEVRACVCLGRPRLLLVRDEL